MRRNKQNKSDDESNATHPDGPKPPDRPTARELTLARNLLEFWKNNPEALEAFQDAVFRDVRGYSKWRANQRAQQAKNVYTLAIKRDWAILIRNAYTHASADLSSLLTAYDALLDEAAKDRNWHEDVTKIAEMKRLEDEIEQTRNQ